MLFISVEAIQQTQRGQHQKQQFTRLIQTTFAFHCTHPDLKTKSNNCNLSPSFLELLLSLLSLVFRNPFFEILRKPFNKLFRLLQSQACQRPHGFNRLQNTSKLNLVSLTHPNSNDKKEF